MKVYLVHHAEATPSHVDAQQPLTSRGRLQADSLAAEAKRAAIAPTLIWHSGKLRSRQTAEALLVACNPFASFRMVRGLAPDDPVEWIADAIEMEDVDVLLVGHMPHLPALTRRLTAFFGEFPLHGLVGLERMGERVYEERIRWQPSL
jgi:phosphohistidine phosphatase